MFKRLRDLWTSTYYQELGPLFISANPDSMNLPRVRWYWSDEHRGVLVLEWGNGNSDPVWSVGLSVWVPW